MGPIGCLFGLVAQIIHMIIMLYVDHVADRTDRLDFRWG